MPHFDVFESGNDYSWSLKYRIDSLEVRSSSLSVMARERNDQELFVALYIPHQSGLVRRLGGKKRRLHESSAIIRQVKEVKSYLHVAKSSQKSELSQYQGYPKLVCYGEDDFYDYHWDYHKNDVVVCSSSQQCMYLLVKATISVHFHGYFVYDYSDYSLV
ncbi:hypothetical protein RND71_032035 [Anisodus tanguticus]|uniref:Uncharacterized protein n=1 Tax=Anisodus tanguticus TaxID=243964 RepID=A0AAE1RBU7_9SOLA|nr:hypothetical protein RND71_032035 [Anisodus tanguticus]